MTPPEHWGDNRITGLIDGIVIGVSLTSAVVLVATWVVTGTTILNGFCPTGVR